VRCIVHADRAYDSNRIRDIIEDQGAVPNIPPKSNRRWKSCFSKTLYKGRNAIERMFCRLKDCRRPPPATTSSPPTSPATSTSPPPLCGGYESWP
jgi:transposase